MNNRDPFGIHYKSPRSPSGFVQSADYFASQVARNIQDQLHQTARTAHNAGRNLFQSPAPLSLGVTMTSAPNGSTSYDSSAPRPGRRATLMGEKMQDLSNIITGNSNEQVLPMYKDKPYNYAPSSRRKPLYRRPRILALIAATILLIFYFMGGSSSIPPPQGLPENVLEAMKGSRVGSTFSTFMKEANKPTSNWNDRRDRVRDAFRISWEAYEKNGWGASLTNLPIGSV